jgi:tetratricopeptide (TPR) repeat protein
MEIPFLFTNEDIFFANNVFMREPFVKQLVEGYNPSYITVPIKHSSFKTLIKPYKQYIPVFFDDIDVLYVNKNHFPAVAEKYSINTIDPFTFANEGAEYIKNNVHTSEIIHELKKIIEIYPDSGVANNCFAIIYINNDEFEKALLHAGRIINIYPESPAGYRLKGDALKGLKKYNEAIDCYKTALKKVDSIETHRQIGLVYLSQKNYKKAYDTLIGSINIYSSYTTYKDLYYVIQAAVMSGRNEEAQILFKYAYSSIPENDRSWLDKYNKLQTIMKEKAL